MTQTTEQQSHHHDSEWSDIDSFHTLINPDAGASMSPDRHKLNVSDTWHRHGLQNPQQLQPQFWYEQQHHWLQCFWHLISSIYCMASVVALHHVWMVYITITLSQTIQIFKYITPWILYIGSYPAPCTCFYMFIYNCSDTGALLTGHRTCDLQVTGSSPS